MLAMSVYLQLLGNRSCTACQIGQNWQQYQNFEKSLLLLVIFKWIIDNSHLTSGFGTIANPNLFLKGI